MIIGNDGKPWSRSGRRCHTEYVDSAVRATKPEAERRAQVEQVLSAIERAWNQGDLRHYADLYTEDAAYVNRAGALCEGRDAIENLHEQALAGPLQGSRLHFEDRRIRFVKDKVAMVYTVLELTHLPDSAPPVRAMASFVVIKSGSEWRIAAVQTTEIAA